MSTLKVAAINNPSASSGGLAISASGNVTGAGLDLITTQSFSAVSSVSVNNCFSATYDNYRLQLDSFGSNSNATDLYIRLRANGTDASSAAYGRAGYYNNTSVSGNLYAASQTTLICGSTANLAACESIDVFFPFLPKSTGFTIISSAWGATSATSLFIGGFHNANTSFDGFTLYPSSGTITGTVSIYGYKK